MERYDIPSLQDLKNIAREVDTGIKHLNKELRSPQKLMFDKNDEKRKKANDELESIATNLSEFKDFIESETIQFKSLVKDFEKEHKTSSECVDGIFKEIENIESIFMSRNKNYVPFKMASANESDLNTPYPLLFNAAAIHMI
uniref:Uncharacterized protein n=1 Tax=Clastoptera arizonana TaxID=38151 RepID=A0A1B6CUL6_9HEMI